MVDSYRKKVQSEQSSSPEIGRIKCNPEDYELIISARNSSHRRKTGHGWQTIFVRDYTMDLVTPDKRAIKEVADRLGLSAKDKTIRMISDQRGDGEIIHEIRKPVSALHAVGIEVSLDEVMGIIAKDMNSFGNRYGAVIAPKSRSK